MSWLTDLLQGIPLNAVLKERVALAEQKFKDLESENKQLKEQVAALTDENALLKKYASETAAKERETPEFVHGCYAFGGDKSKLFCVACWETQGKKHPMAHMRHLGSICTVCQKVVPR